MHLFHSSRIQITLPLRAAVAFALLSASCRAGIAADLLTDPTRPATATAVAAATSRPGAIHVEAIFDRDGQRFAIVDGKVVRAGDQLPWGHIEAVTSTGIRYFSAGKSQLATLDVTKLQVRRASAALEAAK